MDPTLIVPLLLATAAAGGIAAEPPAPVDPISLSAESAPTGVVLRVIGESTRSVEATYSLEVENASGGNRSTQRGRVSLRPNERIVLLTARFGGDAQAGWHATLRVTPRSGKPYEVRRQGP